MKQLTNQSFKQSNKKVFISWSGDTSKKCAEYYKYLLEQIYNTNNDIFISTDISLGKPSLKEIVKALNECNIGIFLLLKKVKTELG